MNTEKSTTHRTMNCLVLLLSLSLLYGCGAGSKPNAPSSKLGKVSRETVDCGYSSDSPHPYQ